MSIDSRRISRNKNFNFEKKTEVKSHGYTVVDPRDIYRVFGFKSNHNFSDLSDDVLSSSCEIRAVLRFWLFSTHHANSSMPSYSILCWPRLSFRNEFVVMHRTTDIIGNNERLTLTFGWLEHDILIFSSFFCPLFVNLFACQIRRLVSHHRLMTWFINVPKLKRYVTHLKRPVYGTVIGENSII